MLHKEKFLILSAICPAIERTWSKRSRLSLRSLHTLSESFVYHYNVLCNFQNEQFLYFLATVYRITIKHSLKEEFSTRRLCEWRRRENM